MATRNQHLSRGLVFLIGSLLEYGGSAYLALELLPKLVSRRPLMKCQLFRLETSRTSTFLCYLKAFYTSSESLQFPGAFDCVGPGFITAFRTLLICDGPDSTELFLSPRIGRVSILTSFPYLTNIKVSRRGDFVAVGCAPRGNCRCWRTFRCGHLVVPSGRCQAPAIALVNSRSS